MAASWAASPTTWALAIGSLVILGYVLYQGLGFQALHRRYARVCQLRAGQRQFYRAVEGLHRRSEALLARVPPTARPAPYTADDEQAKALGAALTSRLAQLCMDLRSPEAGAPPRLALSQLVRGHYWARTQVLGRELSLAESQRRELAHATALADQLGLVLEAATRKPLEQQRAWSDMLAMAEILTRDIQREQQRGTEGLLPLESEAQALLASATERVERLRTAPPPEAVRTTIEAEASRSEFLARLVDLQTRAESISGVHNRALGGQERLDQVLAALHSEVGQLRPPMAEALRAQAAALQRARRDLQARYARHDAAAYEEVARQAATLMTQAYSLMRGAQRLAEADSEAGQMVEQVRRDVVELQQQLQAEQQRSQVRLDLSEAATARAERYVAQLQSLWENGPNGKLPKDQAGATTMLGQVGALAESCRQALAAARETLATWRAQRERLEGVLARLAASAAEHGRLAEAWHSLQGYARSNWPQVPTGWYDGYLRAREGLLAATSQIEGALTSGQVLESSVEDVLSRCSVLEQRWRDLVYDGRQVTVSLSRVQAVERQVLEGLAALRPEVQTVARIEQELPADLPAAVDLQQMSNEILASYRALEDEASRRNLADYRRLRDEGMARLQEQVAQHKVVYGRLLDSERLALKRQLVRIWSRWEPLGQKLDKAAPASAVDAQALARRWEKLMRAGRGPLAGLREISALRAEADELLGDVSAAAAQFESEREAVREAEQGVAFQRRAANQLREHLQRLLAQPYPAVVGEEWDRAVKAWGRGEALLRNLEPRSPVAQYLAQLTAAIAEYQEARLRGRSALVRLLRYAFMEDPDGMSEVCKPLGRRWGQIGVTAREEHIRDLLADAEQAGQVESLVQRVGTYLASRRAGA